MTSAVPALPHSCPAARVADPSRTTSSQRFNIRDRRALPARVPPGLTDRAGRNQDPFVAVKGGVNRRQGVAVTSIYLDQGPGVENENHGP